MFKKIVPILPALNILQTDLFYRNKLYFTSAYAGSYLVVSRDDISINFFEVKDKRNFQSSSCFILVNDIEDVYSKFCSTDMILPEGRLQERQHQLRHFFIKDINGNQLRFGEAG